VLPITHCKCKVVPKVGAASSAALYGGAWGAGSDLTGEAGPPVNYVYNSRMTLSARNRLPGQIEEIVFGDVMAHMVVRVGDNLLESVITRRSADELKLKKGDKVAAVVKATEVMILKD
jgi:molybdopterin-binding protein